MSFLPIPIVVPVCIHHQINSIVTFYTCVNERVVEQNAREKHTHNTVSPAVVVVCVCVRVCMRVCVWILVLITLVRQAWNVQVEDPNSCPWISRALIFFSFKLQDILKGKKKEKKNTFDSFKLNSLLTSSYQ